MTLEAGKQYKFWDQEVSESDISFNKAADRA